MVIWEWDWVNFSSLINTAIPISSSWSYYIDFWRRALTVQLSSKNRLWILSFGRRGLKIINKLEGLPSLLLFTGLMELGSGIKFQWISLYQNLFSFIKKEIYRVNTFTTRESYLFLLKQDFKHSYPESYVGCNQVCDGEAKTIF